MSPQSASGPALKVPRGNEEEKVPFLLDPFSFFGKIGLREVI